MQAARPTQAHSPTLLNPPVTGLILNSAYSLASPCFFSCPVLCTQREMHTRRSQAVPRPYGLPSSQILQVPQSRHTPWAPIPLISFANKPSLIFINNHTSTYRHTPSPADDIRHLWLMSPPQYPIPFPDSIPLESPCFESPWIAPLPEHRADHSPGTASEGGRSRCSSLCQGYGGSPAHFCFSVLLCMPGWELFVT